MMPGAVWPRLRPLVSVLVSLQPLGRVADKLPYFVQVTRCTKAQDKRTSPHGYILTAPRRLWYRRKRKNTSLDRGCAARTE